MLRCIVNLASIGNQNGIILNKRP